MGSSPVTLVAGSWSPCSSSTSIPVRNCSTSNGARTQSIPISSPIRRASSAVKLRSTSHLGLPASLDPPVVVAPDQPVDAEVPRQASKARDEGDADERETEHHHQGEDLRVGVLRGVEGRDLVPEGVEPEPDLPRIAARSRSSFPTGRRAGAAPRRGSSKKPPAGEEQQRLGVVRLVELARRQQGAVEPAALGQADQRAHHRGDRTVAAGGQRRAARPESGPARARPCTRRSSATAGSAERPRTPPAPAFSVALPGMSPQRIEDEVLVPCRSGSGPPASVCGVDPEDLLAGAGGVVVWRAVGGDLAASRPAR